MEIIALLVFIVIALLGWGCGVLHDKWFNYCPTADEEGAFNNAAHTSDGELSLKDILKTNSIKGFQAI